MAKRNRRSGGESGRDRPRASAVVEDVALAEAARSRYLNYALSVITSRALPDVRDGLKPVQRRILYAMWHDLHVTAESRYIKCAAVIGRTMETYHPHGDQAIYDALVRMAQPFMLRQPLIDGYGNFGSIDGDPPAAHRYTECRLTPIAQMLMAELREQTVDFRPNYASTADEPVVLPAQFPNLLVNGVSGIAVGMATNIPPHNLKEVCHALVALLDNGELAFERLVKYIQGPDFPTGGVILNTSEEIRQIYATGQGTIKLRGTYEPHPERAGAMLITSIPYGIEKDALVERIGELIAKGQVPQLTNVKDLSTDDVRILLELKPGANAEAAMAYLFKNSPLQINYSINLTCLLPAEGAAIAVPSRLDLKTILQQFLDFRLDVVTRRLQFELKNLLERIHILEGFAIVFRNLDEAIRIIRASDGKADAAPKLMARFELSELQADAVLETKLYRLGKLEIKDILAELAAKRKRAKEIQDLLDDEPARWQIIRSEIKQIAQTFGEPRRTRIEVPAAPMEFREEDYIVDEDAWVIVTRDGWTKRQKSFTDVASIRVRDDDRVGWVYRARARQTLTFFTDRGIAYTLRVNDIPMTTGHGDPIQKQFAFEDQEHIVGVVCHDPRCLPDHSRYSQTGPRLVQRMLGGDLDDDAADGEGEAGRHGTGNGHANGNGEVSSVPAPPYAVALTAGGKVLRFALAPLAAVSTRKGRLVVRLDPSFKDDLVVGVQATNGSENVCLATRMARVLIFPVIEANIVAGAARGVNAIKLDAKDRVIGFVLTNKKREGLTVRTNRGATQIVRATKFPIASRGGKGYAILQRGTLEALLPDEAEPVPALEEFNDGPGNRNGTSDADPPVPGDDGGKDG
ncbi:MAG: DNA topoisomerase (ATP-hydrolyzing) subunit A [Isosphaeraceae bacterium]